MTFNPSTRRTMTGIALAAAAVAVPAAAQAQVAIPMSDAEVQTLPPEYQTGPIVEEYTDTVVGADGVETITRTRRIETANTYPAGHSAPAHVSHGYAPGHGYAPAYAPAASVFQREQWIDECERRTNGRGNSEKGGIIGALLGAVAGGFIGDEVAAAGDRLGGTLIGAGVGGLGGLLIGGLIGGGRNDRGDYDCEAALDSYLSQYGYPGAAPVARVAARSIPAPTYAPAPAPAYGYGYGYAPAYQSYGYTYAPPQQVVYVPVQYQQQQRVIVRETVREETYEVPGAARTIPAPAPVVQPVPRPVQPRYIKGN